MMRMIIIIINFIEFNFFIKDFEVITIQYKLYQYFFILNFHPLQNFKLIIINFCYFLNLSNFFVDFNFISFFYLNLSFVYYYFNYFQLTLNLSSIIFIFIYYYYFLIENQNSLKMHLYIIKFIINWNYLFQLILQ